LWRAESSILLGGDEHKTIWVIHAYWKKTSRLEDAVKTLVARRIKNLKGGIQDGSVK
jgi:phage-related protein